MGKIIITFNSVTYSIKARKILTRSGINSKLVKVSADSEYGCTHGVEIFANTFLDAVNELKKANIPYSVYQI